MIKLRLQFLIKYFLFGITLFLGCRQHPSDNHLPNILIIVADDLGYSDLGCYGSEIKTPNLDLLANQGFLLSQFYATPACSPTRAALLTGLDPHLVGLGTMNGEQDSNQVEHPAYSGVLNPGIVTIPELLQKQGYFTAMAGKWHLGGAPELLPNQRGFHRSFSLVQGGASHFGDLTGIVEGVVAKYHEDGKSVTVPTDFYSTNFYTNQLIQYLKENQDTGQPFFAYLPYTAPHWPLQVPDAYLDRYQGVYDQGYDYLKQRRIRKQQELGLVSDSIDTSKPFFVEDWESHSQEDQMKLSRKMEIYAGMIECMDENIGRLFEYLKSSGQYEETLILFFSDNGPEGNPIINLGNNANWIPRAFDNSLSNMGKVNSYIYTGPGWAQASAAPFNWFKTFSYEGGIRVPCIIKPIGKKMGQSELVQEPIDITDLSTTILNSAGFSRDSIFKMGLKGRDLYQILESESLEETLIIKELFGRRGLRKGNWKLVWQGPPYGLGKWELFNLQDDPGEQLDISDQYPMILEALIKEWEDYKTEHNLILPSRDMGYANEVLSE